MLLLAWFAVNVNVDVIVIVIVIVVDANDAVITVHIIVNIIEVVPRSTENVYNYKVDIEESWELKF